MSRLCSVISFLCVVTALHAGDWQDFNPGWRFLRSDVPGAESPGFDDRSWSLVSAPHTYNDSDTFSHYSLTGHQGEQNQYGGKAVYRKTFAAPASWAGQKVFVEFEAVRQVGEVYSEAGKLEARGLDANGKLIAADKKETVGKPVKLRLTPMTGAGGWKADGSDVVLVDVEAVDSEGRRHPTVQQRVDFKLVGDAIWRGGYNSGKELSVNNTFLDLECGVNRVAIRSKVGSKGPVKLVATSDGLESAEIILTPESGASRTPAPAR
jgi:hypothetical protein